MGDFYQNGTITTLHNLSRRPLEELEQELHEFAKKRPMGLILPSLYSELEGPALGNILEELSHASYFDEIVIGLDRADAKQFRHAMEYFGQLPQRHRILWNDGPRLKKVQQVLLDQGLAPTDPGKGANVWYCIGYTLASARATSVALHDCDILTYTRELAARLIYPVAHPNFNYRFCKGYYARVSSGKIHGRVCRLLVTPLIRSLKDVLGDKDYLSYLDSFRYPLAGEFSMRTDVLNDLRIPSDWGLEIGVISELSRNYSVNRICQVDIADNYDHKHQNLSPKDASRGLSKMSTDICKAVFRKLATQGVVFSEGTFRSLKASYYRKALDMMTAYHNDAVMNGLKYSQHDEEAAVELFAENLMTAGTSFLNNPMETPFIPSWNRVISAVPDILAQLKNAVEADRAEYAPNT
jgi:glucosyl-3-phosphoglycerate synthase